MNGETAKTSWAIRVAELKKWILKLSDFSELQGEVCAVVYLYYDDFDAKTAALEILAKQE